MDWAGVTPDGEWVAEANGGCGRCLSFKAEADLARGRVRYWQAMHSRAVELGSGVGPLQDAESSGFRSPGSQAAEAYRCVFWGRMVAIRGGDVAHAATTSVGSHLCTCASTDERCWRMPRGWLDVAQYFRSTLFTHLCIVWALKPCARYMTAHVPVRMLRPLSFASASASGVSRPM